MRFQAPCIRLDSADMMITWNGQDLHVFPKALDPSNRINVSRTCTLKLAEKPETSCTWCRCIARFTSIRYQLEHAHRHGTARRVLVYVHASLLSEATPLSEWLFDATLCKFVAPFYTHTHKHRGQC